MTIVTLLYLSGAVTGTVIGEAYKPLSLPFHDKDCYTHTKTTKEYNSKLWLMSLNGEGEYCNPSVENISKEVFLAIDTLTTLLYPILINKQNQKP